MGAIEVPIQSTINNENRETLWITLVKLYSKCRVENECSLENS